MRKVPGAYAHRDVKCARHRPARDDRLHRSRPGSARPDPRPGRRRARLSPLLPALALLLAALSPFAAPPAQAQIPVWSATLTVDVKRNTFGNLVRGCIDPSTSVDACSTALTDNDFEFGGTTYTVTGLYVVDQVYVVLDFDKTAPTPVLNLHLGTEHYYSGFYGGRQSAYGIHDARWFWNWRPA